MYKRRKNRKTKAECQKLHALRRAAERYGAQLTGADLGRMVALIQSNQSTFVSRTSLRAVKHIVPYKGIDYLVVYDHNRCTIASFLPPDAKELNYDTRLQVYNR